MYTKGDYWEILNAILKILIIIVMHVRGQNKLELKFNPTVNILLYLKTLTITITMSNYKMYLL